MNRRLVSFILCILLFLNIISAVDFTKEGTQRVPSDIIFIATPFVRIGFSSIPVTAAVEPQDSLKRNSASFSGGQGVKPSTDIYYLYAQAFTTDRVKVTVETASALKGVVYEQTEWGSTTATNMTYHWSLTFTPYGNDTGLKPVEIKSNGFVPKNVLDESGLDDEDTKYPRSYCWGFKVTMDEEYTPPAELNENGEIQVTISTV